MNEQRTEETRVAVQECELNNRKDLTCECFKDEEELWGPACKSYQPWNDGYGQEYCEDCGHKRECHE